MCIPLKNRLDILTNKENSDTIFENNQIDQNEEPREFYLHNKDQLKTYFTIFLIFLYILIVNMLIFPNLDKNNLLGIQNVLLLCILPGLYFFFRRLINKLSKVVNMEPRELEDMILWTTKLLLWYKTVQSINRKVLYGLIFIVVVKQVITGILLLVYATQK